MQQPLRSYKEIVRSFAQHGADIIRTDARTHYEHIGKNARRPLEPGFIPLDRPPMLTAISYYPNESDIASVEFNEARTAFNEWGASGNIEDYERAYTGWLAFRKQIPFYRRWEAPLFERLGIRDEETAWLPLVKCPLPAGTAVDKEGMDVFRDRNVLWEQLLMVRPAVILVQGAVVYDIVGKSLDNLDFVRRHALQKIPQFAKSAMMEQQIDDLTRILAPAIEQMPRRLSTNREH